MLSKIAPLCCLLFASAPVANAMAQDGAPVVSEGDDEIVASPSATMVRPALTLGKSLPTHAIASGSRLRLRLFVTNIGSNTAKDVSICQRMPRHTQFVRASHEVSFQGREACFSLGDLDSGARGDLRVVLRVDRDAPTATLASTATASGELTEPQRTQMSLRVRGQ